MIKLSRFFNTLNFDTAFGAASFVFAIAYFLKIEIGFTIYFALFISVLSIYNIDHLVDALKLNDSPKSYRHTYYQNHFKWLVYWQIALLLVGIIILFYLPALVFWAGIGLLFIIGIYFWIIFSFTTINLIFREVVVAMGYTIAVAFVPFLSGIFDVNLGFFWILTIVFLIALTNLWIFSMYDIEIDNGQKKHSIARSMRLNNLQKMLRVVISLTFMLIISFTFFYKQWVLGNSLLFIELVYLLLLEKQVIFRKNDYYRLIGEAVLMFPGLIIILYNAV